MLSRQQAKKYYDKFGKKQDWQGFYEDIATNALVRNGELDSAVRVFEFGCGTGRFGQKLLENHLPSNARYVGIDISDTMIGLAKDRLARFGDRAEVHQVDGSPKIDFEAESFDRFVSTYVLDLLSIEDIQAVLQEAWRILTPGGLIGLTSLTHGFTMPSRVLEKIWMALFSIRPMLVGGCRPISLAELVKPPGWKVRYNDKVSRFGVPSEVIVAEKVVAA
jgi:ubiquinone/menaquinone biosynthesis C-methylase UbiE